MSQDHRNLILILTQASLAQYHISYVVSAKSCRHDLAGEEEILWDCALKLSMRFTGIDYLTDQDLLSFWRKHPSEHVSCVILRLLITSKQLYVHAVKPSFTQSA